MTIFPNWQDFAVHQREAGTGCIPTGYEMLLKAAGVDYVDFSSFQEDFDLDIGKVHGQDQFLNDFDSVADAVRNVYPNIIFNRTVFNRRNKGGTGQDKLEFVEQLLRQSQFCLIALFMHPINGQNIVHIMPVIDMDDERLYLLNGVQENGNPDSFGIRKTDFIALHDNFDPGNDVAYLESW